MTSATGYANASSPLRRARRPATGRDGPPSTVASRRLGDERRTTNGSVGMSSRPRSRREELVESIAQGALLLADDDRVLAINDAARALLAIGSDESVRTAADVLTHRALVAAVGDVRATGHAVTVEADHHGA